MIAVISLFVGCPPLNHTKYGMNCFINERCLTEEIGEVDMNNEVLQVGEERELLLDP